MCLPITQHTGGLCYSSNIALGPTLNQVDSTSFQGCFIYHLVYCLYYLQKLLGKKNK